MLWLPAGLIIWGLLFRTTELAGKKKKEKNDKQGGVAEKDSHICKESFSADTAVEVLTPARGQVTFPHLTSQPVFYFFFAFPKRRTERSHVNMRFTF